MHCRAGQGPDRLRQEDRREHVAGGAAVVACRRRSDMQLDGQAELERTALVQSGLQYVQTLLEFHDDKCVEAAEQACRARHCG